LGIILAAVRFPFEDPYLTRYGSSKGNRTAAKRTLKSTEPSYARGSNLPLEEF